MNMKDFDNLSPEDRDTVRKDWEKGNAAMDKLARDEYIKEATERRLKK